MGVLDALTILGAGVGRGYRGSQELQRQISEQKRKALLEEREQIVRETTAKSQQALQEAQIQTEAVNRAIGQFGLDVNKRKEARGTTPITSGGAPLKFKLGDQEISLPADPQTLSDQSGLITQILDNMFKDKHPEYFTNYPPAGTKAAEIKLEPRARKIDYLLKAAGAATAGGPTQFETLDDTADKYNARVAQTFNFILGQMKEADPEAFSEIKKAVLADTTDTGDEDLPLDIDRPALEPKKAKSKNRFSNVKVK